jgi:hypothetical protein
LVQGGADPLSVLANIDQASGPEAASEFARAYQAIA